MKALVTSGGTREKIDDVRFITNFSTGRTGARIVEALASQGVHVDHLVAEGAAHAQYGANEVKTFASFRDLNASLQEKLRSVRYDLILHLAAVSDYSLDSIEQYDKCVTPAQIQELGKIETAETLTLHLKKNFKIIERIKSYARRDSNPFLVGFKLTATECELSREKAIHKLSSTNATDLIIHNDLREIQTTGRHTFRIYKGARNFATATSPAELVSIILNEVRTSTFKAEELL